MRVLSAVASNGKEAWLLESIASGELEDGLDAFEALDAYEDEP